MTNPSVKVENLLGMITIKLKEDNFAKWAFQFKSVLKGYKLFGHFDGTLVCPPKFVIHPERGVTSALTDAYVDWESTDMALLSLLLATLSDEAIEYVLGCVTACEAWSNLVDRFASVSKSRVNHLKTELHTIQKGGDSIDRYLLRLKNIREQLTAAGELIYDNDVIIAGLAGLPKEFAIIRTVILARESSISLKEFRALLLGAKKEIEGESSGVSNSLSALYVQGSQSTPGASSASGSNPAGHSHLPETTGGVLTSCPYLYSADPYMHQYSSPFVLPQQYPQPLIPQQFHPPVHSSIPYGFGYMGNAPNSGPKPPFMQKPNYKGNSGYKSNTGFKGKGYNTSSSSGYSSGVSRQYGSSGWHGNTENRGNYVFQGQQPSSNLTAMAAQQTEQPMSQDACIIDTGASHHIIADVNTLSQVTPFQGSSTITIGNGTSLSIANTGVTTIKTNSHNLVLNNVLHDKKTRAILHRGKSRAGQLFQIPVVKHSRGAQSVVQEPSVFLGQLVKSNLWHQRFGHPTNEIMSIMLRQSNILVDLDASHSICTHCIQGKMCRLPFSPSSDRYCFPFEKVHSDVWGPAPVKTVEGYRYYVTFVDQYTKYTWIFPMYNKSDVYSIFLKFYNLVLTQFGVVIKCLQTDGGGEYTGHSFKAFLDAKGVEHLISCPYTPQQNGVVERKHRHIVEIAITLLVQAALPIEFWYYACAHAVFLINRMPCKGLSMESPYKKLFAKIPELKSLKVFGSAVYPWLRPYSVHKLQPRSAQCVFLGYSIGYKGVICYHVQTKKCFISRHVVFYESVFPYALLKSSVQDNVPVHSQFSRVVVPIPVVPRSSNHGTSSSQHGQEASSSSSPAVHHDIPTSSTTSSPTTRGFETQAVSQTLSSSPYAGPLLPVLNPAQLQVILSLPPSHTHSQSPSQDNVIQTRLKTGAIVRRDYTSFLASLPQLESLQFLDSNPGESNCSLSCGFSFLADIHEVEEPRNFKAASTVPQW
ncbi:hypothetical protein ACFX13_011546 [Malus domestica]